MRALVALTGLLFAGVSPLANLEAQRSQRDVQLEIGLPTAGAMQEGPSIATNGNLLADARTRELLRNGLPTQIHYRLELWRKGRVFDDPTDKVEWDVLVQYDPLAKVYNVERRMGKLQESFVGTESVTGAEMQFDRPFRVALSPTRPGRYYYNLAVDVRTLTESDLDALQEWLRGPAAPGKGNPLNTFRSGVGTLLSRILGKGDHYERKSSDFTVER